MSLLNALTVSIGVLAAVATWLFLGPLGGALQIWAAFVAWGCFYHCGGKEGGLMATITSTVFGALVGWITLFVFSNVNLGASLGVPVWAGLAVGVGVGAMVALSRIKPFATIPGSVYGFACIAAYVLLAKPASLTSGDLTNPLVVIALSLIVGALFGYASEKLGVALAKT